MKAKRKKKRNHNQEDNKSLQKKRHPQQQQQQQKALKGKGNNLQVFNNITNQPISILKIIIVHIFTYNICMYVTYIHTYV